MKKIFGKKSILCNVVVFMLAIVASLFCFVLKDDGKLNDAEATTYIVANDVANDLLSINSALPSYYNLAEIYPISAENQTNSNFCWIYSSMKALETSIMVNQNEYHNFSEAALAYFSYKDEIDKNTDSNSIIRLNNAGNFERFIEVYQTYGLVYESDFSDDKYFDLDEDNIENYSFVEDFAIDNYSDVYYPVALGDSFTYLNSTMANKQKIIKEFILNYGGLFCGVDPGTIYPGSAGNFYINDPEKQTDGGVNFSSSGHAVCLIGWDDTIVVNGVSGAFLALNSWGMEDASFETFYIPYNIPTNASTYSTYYRVYNYIYGFIYTDINEEKMEITSSSATDFSTDIVQSEEVMKNMFCYDETINLDFKVNKTNVNFNEMRVKVFRGREEVTQLFSIVPTSSTNSISINYNKPSDRFYGGYYTVKVYFNDELYSAKDFYIYSGTEVAYFRMDKVNQIGGTYESVALNNSNLSSDETATFYLAMNQDYKLTFYLTAFNRYSNLGNSLEYSMEDISVYSSTYPEKMNFSTNNLFSVKSGIICDLSNTYEISISNLSSLGGFSNCQIKFAINISSNSFSGVSNKYYVNLFISSLSSTRSSQLKSIEYELNGGVNSAQNPRRFPSYTRDADMTTIELENPTQIGKTFIGWYLTPDFSGESITEINSSFLEDIVLYAKWDEEDIDYFDISFGLNSIISYSETQKDLDDDIVYGDSIGIKFEFLPDLALSGISHTVTYYYYVNGHQIDSGNIIGNQNIINFELNFPNLKSGNYNFEIIVIVVLSNSYSIIESENFDVTVNKKLVSFEFSGLEYIYDGELHYPTISVKAGSFYAEDLTDAQIEDMFTVNSYAGCKNFGNYNYSIISLADSNYYFDPTKVSCIMRILKKDITVTWKEFSATYNKLNHVPEFEFVGVVEGDSVSASLEATNFVLVGHYTVNIKENSLTNENYNLVLGEDFAFNIMPAYVKVKINNVTDRLQTPIGTRTSLSYQIEGTVYQGDDLKVSLSSVALTANTSGAYEITGTYNNSNYDVEFENGVYRLTGFYYIYYELPDGSVYTELVEDGEEPKGVDVGSLSLPPFSRIIYSDKLTADGTDLHVAVYVESYKTEVIIIAFIAVFILVSVIIYFYRRRNKVS